ncbi:MAG: hypothetical protein Q8O52_17360 [Sulfuritalea sp.]|nr:hypothetical protein [Sulfuritalea sp.]
MKPEPPADDEIGVYRRKASLYLRDAALDGMSSAGRFMLAYDAAHALAFAALRAKGYRPDSARGHRAVVFQALEVTVGAPKELWIALDRYHTRRNASEYSGMIEASKIEADDLLDLAKRLDALCASVLGG